MVEVKFGAGGSGTVALVCGVALFARRDGHLVVTGAVVVTPAALLRVVGQRL